MTGPSALRSMRLCRSSTRAADASDGISGWVTARPSGGLGSRNSASSGRPGVDGPQAPAPEVPAQLLDELGKTGRPGPGQFLVIGRDGRRRCQRVAHEERQRLKPDLLVALRRSTGSQPVQARGNSVFWRSAPSGDR